MGWISLALGVGSGLVLGMWSFDGPLDVPRWIGAYGDTSRRLVRLGHIALIGLGILDILLGRELLCSLLSSRMKQVASRMMIFGNVFLPLTLFAAGFEPSLKYAMALPASSVFAALSLAAWGARAADGPPGKEQG
ncbi:MAG: hypothetical protein HOP15_14280 [Planctomycetes bacterium]|nr:hypothetical protein [Planctomycetota bacterium]